MIAVNKADGDREGEARSAARELAGPLRLVHGKGGWVPPVVNLLGLTGTGVEDVWKRVLGHRDHLGEDGLAAKRARQQLEFTWSWCATSWSSACARHRGCVTVREEIHDEVRSGRLPATAAAERLLAAFDADPRVRARAGH